MRKKLDTRFPAVSVLYFLFVKILAFRRFLLFGCKVRCVEVKAIELISIELFFLLRFFLKKKKFLDCGNCLYFAWIYGIHLFGFMILIIEMGGFMLMWVLRRCVMLLLGYWLKIGYLKKKQLFRLFGHCGLRLLDRRVSGDCWSEYWWVCGFVFLIILVLLQSSILLWTWDRTGLF